jgi:predicted CXXCH cytochrome family protein
MDTTNEFDTSVHGQQDLTCVRCHNSHTTKLKKDTVEELCASCHQDLTHFYGHSTHAEEDVLCTDCHLQSMDGERDGPGHRLHTFEVNLQTCTACHSEDMHTSEEADICSPEEIEKSIADGLDLTPCTEEEIAMAGLSLPEDEALMSEPLSVNPLSFAIIGALVGMAAGLILAPWMETWFRRNQE